MKPIFSWGICATVFLTMTAALGHDNATGAVKQRMDHMKDVARQTKLLVGLMNGTQAFDAQQVRNAALHLGELGGTALTDLFPENSLEMPTEARPEIWSNWEQFSKIANELSLQAHALADASDDTSSPETLKSVFDRLAGTCKSCHQDFRIETDG